MLKGLGYQSRTSRLIGTGKAGDDSWVRQESEDEAEAAVGAEGSGGQRDRCVSRAIMEMEGQSRGN